MIKFLPALIASFVQKRQQRQNLKVITVFCGALLALVVIYSIGFHVIMEREGRKDEHGWFAGFYWTLTTMSTLGFGDITFRSILGQAFSILVLISGMVFLLVVLPFTFIEFFYAPWMAAHSAARAPRELPEKTSGHVLITHYDEVTHSLINKLHVYKISYSLLMADLAQALELHDLGFNVMVGDLDNPKTYQRARADQAALVAATGTDTSNTNVAFTVREMSAGVKIVTTASKTASVDILELSGSNYVMQLPQMMGRSLARRASGGDALAHAIGNFNRLLIAEASAAGTPLVNQTLKETRLRELTGVSIIGIWERGQFINAGPDVTVTTNSILVLAATQAQLKKYNQLFCIYHISEAPVIIIGAGRVGRATGEALERRKIDYRIVEKLPDRILVKERYVFGDAADYEVLKAAGIEKTSTIIITTHEDDMNIYLTIYCRRLRPDIQIISRSTRERNVSSLHRAGADFVLSYASMGANAIFNYLQKSDILMIAEGLNVFRTKVPPALAGKTLIESAIRAETGTTVIAINNNNDMKINPDPVEVMEPDAEIVLIGSFEAQDQFVKRYGG